MSNYIRILNYYNTMAEKKKKGKGAPDQQPLLQGSGLQLGSRPSKP